MEQNYENGVPQGLSKEYYENVTLKSESNLTGEPWEYSGYTNTFYEDGKKHTESQIRHGEITSSVSYDREGRVSSEYTGGTTYDYWYEENGKSMF